MTLSITKSVSFIFVSYLLTSNLSAEINFPEKDSATAFKLDLKKSSLIANIPNTKGSDHFIGLSLSGGGLDTESGNYLLIPGARVSIYPNPDYNLWAQFSTWPGDQPGFSVGTGFQSVFRSDKSRDEQAIGLSWNTIYGDGYSQRDISVHALYARFSDPLEYGLMAVLNMHHILVDKSVGVKSYDETLVQIVPYISLLFGGQYKTTVVIPISMDGMALSLNVEWLLGKRE